MFWYRDELKGAGWVALLIVKGVLIVALGCVILSRMS